MFALITIALFTVFLTGLFNGVETALLSVPMSKAKLNFEQKKPGSKSLLSLKERIYQPITLLVIFINVVGLGGSVLVGSYGAKVLGNVWLGIFSGILIFSVTMFGDIIPKNLGVRYALPFALVSAPFLKLSIKFFSPLLWLISHMAFLKKIVSCSPLTTSEEEIRFLTTIGAKSGVIKEDRRE